MNEHELEKKAAAVVHTLEREAIEYRKTVIERFPFLMISLSTLGLVATFCGFERIIDTIPYLAHRPYAILIFGITLLTITGTLYKKLR